MGGHAAGAGAIRRRTRLVLLRLGLVLGLPRCLVVVGRMMSQRTTMIGLIRLCLLRRLRGGGHRLSLWWSSRSRKRMGGGKTRERQRERQREEEEDGAWVGPCRSAICVVSIADADADGE